MIRLTLIFAFTVVLIWVTRLIPFGETHVAIVTEDGSPAFAISKPWHPIPREFHYTGFPFDGLLPGWTSDPQIVASEATIIETDFVASLSPSTPIFVSLVAVNPHYETSKFQELQLAIGIDGRVVEAPIQNICANCVRLSDGVGFFGAVNGDLVLWAAFSAKRAGPGSLVLASVQTNGGANVKEVADYGSERFTIILQELAKDGLVAGEDHLCAVQTRTFRTIAREYFQVEC